MNIISSLFGHLSREKDLLQSLNKALLVLEAQALGRSNDFDFSEKDVEKSRKLLKDFVKRLHDALGEDEMPTDFGSLVHRIRSGMKPLEDWREDLTILDQALDSRSQIQQGHLPILEDVLSLLDLEFTRDLRRLYSR